MRRAPAFHAAVRRTGEAASYAHGHFSARLKSKADRAAGIHHR